MTSRRIEESAPLSQAPLGLEQVQTGASDFDPRAVEANFQRIQDLLRPLFGGDVSLQTVAYVFGGQALVADVAASTSASGSDDTVIPHGLNRPPNYVLMAVDTGGLGGAIMGKPSGGDGASGSNQTPWDRDNIYVRATVTSSYVIIIL